MRWIVVKDLQILRRSPLLTALLVIYPIAIAVLIGFALSRGPEKPRVAFLNLVPAEQEFNVGRQNVGGAAAKVELCARVECVDVDSREEAVDKVESGDVLAALILPEDLVEKLQSLTTLNPEQATVEILVNEEDPVKARFVDERIRTLITEANLQVSRSVSKQAARYLDLLTEGGRFQIPFVGRAFEILGLRRASAVLHDVRAQLPEGSPTREALDSVIRFADLARRNLDFALPLLGAVAEPIAVDKEVVSGDAPSLDSFAIAVSATVTLLFVTVLLVAGSLALEHEENAFTRLTRGLVRRWELLAAKITLGIAVSIAVTVAMLAGLEIFVSIAWERFGLILLAIVAGGAAFAAFGAAIGGVGKDVRASSLLAFMVALPVAFISLIPSGAVSGGLFHVIEVVRALFPFQPALRAMSGALEASGPALGVSVLHLAILTAAYAVLAHIALRRFA